MYGPFFYFGAAFGIFLAAESPRDNLWVAALLYLAVGICWLVSNAWTERKR